MGRTQFFSGKASACRTDRGLMDGPSAAAPAALSGVPPNAAPVSALVTISISHVDRWGFLPLRRNLKCETPTPANLFQAEAPGAKRASGSQFPDLPPERSGYPMATSAGSRDVPAPKGP
jgi:hypothetical protein